MFHGFLFITISTLHLQTNLVNQSTCNFAYDHVMFCSSFSTSSIVSFSHMEILLYCLIFRIFTSFISLYISRISVIKKLNFDIQNIVDYRL